MNNDEQKAAETALNEAEAANRPSLGHIQMARPDQGPATVPYGYHEVELDQLPSQGMFYPVGTKLFIRPATVAEIRHFSTVEENPFSAAEAFSELVKGCVQLRQPGQLLSYKDLCEEDRFFIVMKVRDLTFVKGEHKLVVTNTCPSCATKGEIEVKSHLLVGTMPDATILKYYSEGDRMFVFRTKSQGEIPMVTPSIGVADYVAKYILESTRAGRKLDVSFVKLLPFLEPNWRKLNPKRVSDLEIEVKQWSMERFQLMNSLVEKVSVRVKENLVSNCASCGVEIETPLTFPGGVRGIFIVQDLSGELL